MRILVTFVGGVGHLLPLLPLARAARAAGDEVAFAGSGGLVPRIEQAGFAAYATSPSPHHSGAPAGRDLAPVHVMGEHATEVEFAENFATRGARRMASAVPGVIEDFRPDVVVRDETDLGTTIAAELADVPVVTHLVLASGLLVRPELVAPRLDAVRAEHGLAPDPDLSRLTSGTILSDAPPSFRSPDAPLALAPLHYRPEQVRRVRQGTGRPLVYATLGTIFNTTSGDLLERLVTGLVGLEADAVVTVGTGIDPADLGPLPAHVRIERFVPHDEVLARASLVVSHGGSGTFMAALAHGLPSVLLPLGADQPHNARRARELGLATTMDAAAATPAEIAEQARATLGDVAMVRRCRDVAAELHPLPAVDSAVTAVVEAASSPARREP